MSKFDTDKLGNRMKLYEGIEAQRRFIPTLPVVARLDGRGFSRFTKGMNRPYDGYMTRCMIDTAIALAKETQASAVYTQSDEISMVWHSTNIESQIFFDGRIQKMVSTLSALATIHFYRNVEKWFGKTYTDRMPTFDARVWNVPSRTEAANTFLWREWDATKNSISMAAQHYFSHKELDGKNSATKIEMLREKGVNWNEYPGFFKRGTYIIKREDETKFSSSELEKLPEKHAARLNPNLSVKRNIIDVVPMPIFGSVSNREDVLFEGAEPILL